MKNIKESLKRKLTILGNNYIDFGIDEIGIIAFNRDVLQYTDRLFSAKDGKAYYIVEGNIGDLSQYRIDGDVIKEEVLNVDSILYTEDKNFVCMTSNAQLGMLFYKTEDRLVKVEGDEIYKRLGKYWKFDIDGANKGYISIWKDGVLLDCAKGNKAKQAILFKTGELYIIKKPEGNLYVEEDELYIDTSYNIGVKVTRDGNGNLKLIYGKGDILNEKEIVSLCY